MKYYQVAFNIQAAEEIISDVRDVLSAMCGEAGFETFEETGSGLTGYVQQSLYDPAALEETLAAFPFDDVTIDYELTEAENSDWNQQWEDEGFEPITVSTESQTDATHPTIVIHDGRHLPETEADDIATPIIYIEIDAKLAFGTGNHETTRMMVASLTETPLEGCRVLDCGCGTGILGIAALKLGAATCVGYDIDEWSVDNTRHNAVINRVEDRLSPLLGDATVLDSIEGTFDVVMANINRNILIADMSRFAAKLSPRGILLLSGFYESDVAQLEECAKNMGLKVVGQKTENDWACLKFEYSIETLKAFH